MLIARFRTARSRGNLDEVLIIGGSALAVNPEHPSIRRGMARTLTALKRRDEALEHWLSLRDLDASDAEAAFHVAEALIATGMGADAAVESAAPHGNDRFRGQLRQVLSAPARAIDGPFRHVAICGVSFCGSTIVDRILGGLPGVRSIGESHWLTKEYDGSRYAPIDLSVERSGRGPFCAVCGPKCKVLTQEFRVGLVADPSSWYRKVARQLETSILVSADKNTTKLVDHDPLLDFAALVLFKSPLQAWSSQLAKLPEGRDSEYYLDQLKKYDDVWTNSYNIFLNDLRPREGAIFLQFDDFVRCPEPLLRSLCESLQLPFDESVLKETRSGHAIGGNSGAMARLRAADYGVRLSPLPDPDLPSEHVAIIAKSRPMQSCYAAMMERYRSVFPAV